MTKLPLKHIVILLCFTLILVGCDRDIEYAFDTTTHHSEDLEMCALQECPTIAINVVKLTNPEDIVTKVNKEVLNHILQVFEELTSERNAAIEDAMRRFINDRQIAYPETSLMSDHHELTIDVTTNYSSNEVLSFYSFIYSFTGGAHGIDSENYLNFDPRTGELLLTEDMVTGEFYAFAKAYLEKSIKDSSFNSLEPHRSLQGNLGFSPDGVVIAFKSFDYFAFTDETSYTIPWEDAKPYLKI